MEKIVESLLKKDEPTETPPSTYGVFRYKEVTEEHGLKTSLLESQIALAHQEGKLEVTLAEIHLDQAKKRLENTEELFKTGQRGSQDLEKAKYEVKLLELEMQRQNLKLQGQLAGIGAELQRHLLMGKHWEERHKPQF